MENGWDSIEKAEDITQALAATEVDGRTFSEWIMSRIDGLQLKKKDVIKRSKLNQTFAYQILSGQRKASRDKLIQLAFGMELGRNETDELLVRAGLSALRPYCRRDIAIAWSLSHGWSVDSCDDLLWQLGEKTLFQA